MNDVTLPAAAQARLCELEQIVESGLRTFVAVGDALAGIRSARLYREQYDTFEATAASGGASTPAAPAGS